jgi:hypothetical protein
MASCGGGDGSPTTPNVAGSYSGTVTFTSAAPEAHCFSAGLARLRGHGFRYRIDLVQSGTELSGTLDNTDMQITCSLAGSVAPGGGIRWTQTTCSDPAARFSWSSEAGRTCVLSVTQTGHTFEGMGGLSGELILDWDTADADTGMDLGPLQVRARVDFR